MDSEKQQQEKQEVEDVSGSKPKVSKFLICTILSVNLITILAGISMGWTSPVVPILQSNNTDNPLDYPMTESDLSWFVGSSCLGTILASIFTGLSSKRFGRKQIILAGGVPQMISIFLSAFATNLVTLCFARVFSGLCLGIVYAVLPLYIGEIAEANNRGIMGSSISVTAGIGMALSYGIGPYLPIKVFTLLALIPLGIFFIIFGYFGPESPIYLAYSGKPQEAKQVLYKLRNHLPKGVIDKEFSEILSYINDNTEKVSLREFVNSKALMKTLMIGTVLHSLMHLCGLGSILSLMQTIFDASGSSISSKVSSVIVAGIHVLSVFITVPVIERFGRKQLLIASYLSSATVLVIFGTYYCLKENNYDVSSLFWLPVTCLVLYEFTFHFGVGPIPLLLLGELFPSNAKAMAVTISTLISNFANFGVTFGFPRVYAAFGLSVAFWIFAGFCLFGFIFIVVFFKDTKGKTLFEIQILYKLNTQSH